MVLRTWRSNFYAWALPAPPSCRPPILVTNYQLSEASASTDPPVTQWAFYMSTLGITIAPAKSEADTWTL